MSKRLFQEIIGAVEIVAGTVLVAAVPGGQSIGTSLILTGVGTLGSALLLPSTPKPAALEGALKTPMPPRVSAYGRSRLHGSYSLYTTASGGTACDVYALCDGRIDGYERFYLGDNQVATATGIVAGLPDGAYKSPTVEIDARLGLPTETAYSQLVALLPDQWTADHRGDGVATMMVTWKEARTKDYQEIYPNGQPPGSAVARWQCVYDWRDETQDIDDPLTWQWSENAVLHLAHYLLVRDNKDWSLHFAPTLAFWTAAADDCDEATALAAVQATLATPAAAGTDSIVLNNVNGLATGMSVSVSATGDTSLTEILGVVDVTGTTVSLDANLAFAHPLGSQVTWSSDTEAPATEPRYRGCVAHAHTDEHKGVIANLLACFDGWMSPRSDGALVVFSGRYYAPTVTIGPDQIIGYSLQDGIAEEDAINLLNVTYISENHDFNTVDTDAWADNDDISARGKELSDTAANQVPSASQGRRLAKRKMARIMAPKRGTVTTNASGRTAIGQRYVRLTLIDCGTTFLDAPVEIVKLTRNLMTGGVTFDWILADPNIDAWNPATEEGLPAPIGNPVASLPLEAPEILSAMLFVTDESGTDAAGARVDLVVSALDRGDLTWFVHWRVSGSSIWNEARYTDIDPGTSVELLTGFVPVNALIDVEAAYQVGDGRVSPWSETSTVDSTIIAITTDAGETLLTDDGEVMIKD